MDLATRKVLDRSFTGLGVFSILLMSLALIVLLGPIVIRGSKAFWFQETVEHRRFLWDHYERGDEDSLKKELAEAEASRQPVLDYLAQFEDDMQEDRELRRAYRDELKDVKECLSELLGPLPGEVEPILLRDQYGQTRWDRAQVKLDHVLHVTEYDYSDPTQMGVPVQIPRVERFKGTSLEPLFVYCEKHAKEMLLPRRTFYWRFLFDEPMDAFFFGGIWPAVSGTFYLTLGAILVATPVGIIAAIYLTEYAKETPLVSLLRTCISTLAGVPSIVFGLFGLAFFINALGVSDSKSVLAGSLTLAVLILPTVIRASEEAIRAVPLSYKEASLSLGATPWRTIYRVILPAGLPGILTSIIISMGRAAGETAPIIFTAAVSLGKPLKLHELFTQPTAALPWSVYNVATEHQAVDEIRHVQFGMALTLVGLVLLLNLTAVILRARIARRLRA